MAEKEERILITTRHKDEKLNMTFTDMYKEYTRQEVIEKMAKGMYLLTNPEDTKYADFYNCYFFELAEAAINALLGE